MPQLPLFPTFVPGLSWRVALKKPHWVERDHLDLHSTDAAPAFIPALKGYVFDEVVIDKWLHIEQMDTDRWWIRLGDKMLHLRVRDDGTAELGEWEDSG